MSEPFLGQIIMFAGNFAPRGWSLCDGQLLPINQNQALYSLLGTTYGGDGRTTFALPDLRGRSVKHKGNGAGLPALQLGAKGGTSTHTMIESELGAHNHPLHAENKLADQTIPGGHMLGRGGQDTLYVAPDAATDQVMADESITNTGGGQAFNIQDPYLALNYIISMQGVFPSRN